ncbi:MAG: type II toxin-antitoxin system RelE/ParE family toxin [Ginsengibacter sp.]
MKYALLVSERANEDAIVIFDWYERKLNGLGDTFINELEIAKNDLLNNPLSYAKWNKGIRRMVMRKFPYKLFYKVYDYRIVILAIIHARRSNRYIKRRL